MGGQQTPERCAMKMIRASEASARWQSRCMESVARCLGLLFSLYILCDLVVGILMRSILTNSFSDSAQRPQADSFKL